MSTNNNGIVISFNNKVDLEKNKLIDETLESARKEIDDKNDKINKLFESVKKCVTIGELDDIEIESISDELGLLTSNLIEEPKIKINLEQLNSSYRTLEVAYFNKKIQLLNKTVVETAKKSENNLKDITSSTLFSFASVFLGISLTSALVAGISNISDGYLILYFMTCLLIVVVSIGVAAIFMRNIDVKSLIIFLIIIVVSILWGILATYTFKNIDKSENIVEEKLVVDKDNKEETAPGIEQENSEVEDN